MQDPVDGSPAVLVVRSNITQEKQMEQALAASQEDLQRYSGSGGHNPSLQEQVLLMHNPAGAYLGLEQHSVYKLAVLKATHVIDRTDCLSACLSG